MARVKASVYDFAPQAGKGKGLTDAYYAAEGNKDTLYDIYRTHKRWGEKWYNFVRLKMYDKAIEELSDNKKADGLCFMVAVRCIMDLAKLEREIEELDTVEVK